LDDGKEDVLLLPPLPPRVDIETKGILKKVVAARSALAELKGLGNSGFYSC
jgi:hypothetical protein